MVRDEVHTNGLGTNRTIRLGEVRPQVLHGCLALRYIIHRVVQTPAVVHVERRFGQLIGFVLILGEGEHVGVGKTQVAHCPVPEIGRHFAGYVATETVNTDGVHPPVHRFEHLVAHILVVVVQFGDVRPVVLHHQVAQTVTVMPAVVLGPLAVRRRMVGYPVEDHLEAHLVCLCQEMLEIGTCTELRIDGAVVDDGIVTAERTLTGNLADRLTRHHPDDVNTVLAQGRQQLLGSPERTFRRCLTGVQLIDRSVVRPLGVTHLFGLRAADHRQYRRNKQKGLFHKYNS